MADYSSFDYTDGDVDTNTSGNHDIHSLIETRYSRRTALKSALGVSAAALPAFALAGCGSDDDDEADPVAVTANSVSTSAGRVATIEASVTSGTATGFAWTQTSGPAVTLNNASTATPSFVTPGVAAATPLAFVVTATSASGATATATSTVTVSPGVLGFTAVSKNLNDIVTVPTGYTVQVLYRLGDPIAAGVAPYVGDGSDSNFAQRAGDHHDGMYYFGLSAAGTAPDPSNNTRGLLCINHENITEAYLQPNGPTAPGGVRPADEALKEIEAHGVSVIEVTRAAGNGAWSYTQGSTFNRRITPLTPVTFSGPVRGNALIRTAFSPDGTAGRGTINNCANGFTPWSTYLTCEENWAGYFRREAGDQTARTAAGLAKSNVSLARAGVGGDGLRAGANGWATATPVAAGDTRFAKFNITLQPGAPVDGTGDFRNEINQYGWVVEIDPFDPASTPRKRTALGRFAHEGAWPGRFIAGTRPAWYMGDDSGTDYIYKFVSSAVWATADATATNRLAIGDKYLDAGTLYVARFNADGTGEWLPLTFGTGPLTAAYPLYSFTDQADVLVNTRLAADALGATRMDRPEWTAVNPANGEMYVTLTNGPARSGVQGAPNAVTQVPATLATDAANPRVYVDPPSTARNNRNGHVIRIRETADTTEATSFAWDIYVFAAGQDLDSVNINISGLTAENDMSSPDGLWFSRSQNAGGVGSPLLWVQTDDGAYTDVTNCMMLVGQPGRVNDGGTRSVTNTLAGGVTSTQATRIGALPGTTLRRFLVGPKGCEITGIDSTPDGRTVFVNIQHPGETNSQTVPSPLPSNWPATQGGTAAPTSRPRSATIVITKDDGGVVGL